MEPPPAKRPRFAVAVERDEAMERLRQEQAVARSAAKGKKKADDNDAENYGLTVFTAEMHAENLRKLRDLEMDEELVLFEELCESSPVSAAASSSSSSAAAAAASSSSTHYHGEAGAEGPEVCHSAVHFDPDLRIFNLPEVPMPPRIRTELETASMSSKFLFMEEYQMKYAIMTSEYEARLVVFRTTLTTVDAAIAAASELVRDLVDSCRTNNIETAPDVIEYLLENEPDGENAIILGALQAARTELQTEQTKVYKVLHDIKALQVLYEHDITELALTEWKKISVVGTGNQIADDAAYALQLAGDQEREQDAARARLFSYKRPRIKNVHFKADGTQDITYDIQHEDEYPDGIVDLTRDDAADKAFVDARQPYWKVSGDTNLLDATNHYIPDATDDSPKERPGAQLDFPISISEDLAIRNFQFDVLCFCPSVADEEVRVNDWVGTWKKETLKTIGRITLFIQHANKQLEHEACHAALLMFKLAAHDHKLPHCLRYALNRFPKLRRELGVDPVVLMPEFTAEYRMNILLGLSGIMNAMYLRWSSMANIDLKRQSGDVSSSAGALDPFSWPVDCKEMALKRFRALGIGRSTAQLRSPEELLQVLLPVSDFIYPVHSELLETGSSTPVNAVALWANRTVNEVVLKQRKSKGCGVLLLPFRVGPVVNKFAGQRGDTQVHNICADEFLFQLNMNIGKWGVLVNPNLIQIRVLAAGLRFGAVEAAMQAFIQTCQTESIHVNAPGYSPITRRWEPVTDSPIFQDQLISWAIALVNLA